MSGEVKVGGMHWVRDRRDRWISDEDDAALATEAAMLDEIERLRAAVEVRDEALMVCLRDGDAARALIADEEARRD